MFTGIITDLGHVRSVARRGASRIEIATAYDTGTIGIGSSIACSGVCLTVVAKGDGWFAVDASAETLARTALADWEEDSPVNLERALRVGDELGGHITTGHIDGVGTVVEARPDGLSTRLVIELPGELQYFVAEKGSLCADGVSLTVNEVDGRRAAVNIIPHTRDNTTFGATRVGDRINIEIDILARYLARLAERS